MRTVEVPMTSLRPAAWNPNMMDASTLAKLRTSIERFGLVSPLVARPVGDHYELLSGNQRLTVLRDLGFERVPCVILDVDDAQAMSLALALNLIHGEDDPAQQAALLSKLVAELGEEPVVTLLPEHVIRLQSLARIGPLDIAARLREWERTRAARLRSFIARLTPEQLTVVEEALAPFMAASDTDQHPNRRGNALYRLCQAFLEIGDAP